MSLQENLAPTEASPFSRSGRSFITCWSASLAGFYGESRQAGSSLSRQRWAAAAPTGRGSCRSRQQQQLRGCLLLPPARSLPQSSSCSLAGLARLLALR